MPTSHYPHGFKNGVSIRGLNVLNTYAGNVFWLDYNIGSDGNDGKTPERPFKTLDYAIGRCTASNGDIIMISPGHAESIIAATTVVWDVAGLQIIGLGKGDLRPTFTFTTAAAAAIPVTGADGYIENCRFLCNIASQNHMFDVAADDLEVAFCDFREGSAVGLSFITADTADGDSDNLYIHNSTFFQPTAGVGDAAIAIGKDMANIRIEDNVIYGDFDLACVDVPAGGDACTNLQINRNYMTNLLTGQHCVQVNGSAVTGMCYDNRFATDTQAATLDASLMRCAGNTWTDLATEDAEGIPVNALMDGATNFIGVDDSNNVAATTNVAANADGSILEREEYIQTQVDKIDQVTLDTTPTAASLATFIATGGTALGTQLPASTSLYDAVRAYGQGYLVSKVYAALASYTTLPAFTVTGDVMAKVVGVVGATGITSTSGTTTLAVGTTELATGIIAASTVNNTQFAATDVWVDSSPANDCEIMASAAGHIIGGGADIILTGSADDLTAGTLTLYCFWMPLSAGATVVAA